MGLHRHGVIAFAVEEVGRVRLGRVGQQFDDHVEQFTHAGASARRREAHRDQMTFAQRLFQRRVQLRCIDVAVVEVAFDELCIDFDHLLHQRTMRRIDGAEVAVPRAVIEAVDHLRSTGVRQIQWQAFLAERVLDLLQQRGQIDVL